MRFFVPVTLTAAIIIAAMIGCDKRAIQADPVAITASIQKPPVSELGKKLDSTQRAFFAQAYAEELRLAKLGRVTAKHAPVAISASEAVRYGSKRGSPPE